MQRQFTSGSRQAPDPFDQFLEQHNYYRKHTARDASCLFRVISEQMYDTQKHHLTIRKKCVAYMRKHRSFFQPLVDRDLDEYLDDMSKPRTYGTMIELQAVGYMYQRNVVLFEAFNLGNYFITRPCYEDTFRIFYTPERHFDSVFTCDYIKDAAICQSIVYEILYKYIYKLPDVPFAVEQMLHSPTFDTLTYRTEYNDDGYCRRLYLSDGRVFYFDLPNDTKCILENYKLCYFHCLTEDIQEDTNTDGKIFSKAPESLLPHKYVSCVRQLLIEGITPFPYKVAKALDPNMYRNIEFDAWNEARKELKIINWYNGDTNFKVGAKCNVKLENLDRSRLFTCHIQDISVNRANCLVFVEELGEKRLVPYDSLIPLPADEFKPWSLPYKFQRHFQKYNPYRYKHIGCKIRIGNHFCGSEYCTNFAEYTEDSYQDLFKFNQYSKLDNFRSHVEYCAMPFTVEHTPTFKEKVQQPVNSVQLEESNSSNTGCNNNSGGAESGEMSCKVEAQDYNTSNPAPQTSTEEDSAYSTQFSSSYQGQNSTGMPEEMYGYSLFDPPTSSSSAPFVYMINYPNYGNPVYMPPPAGYPTTQPFIGAPIPQNGSIYYGNNYYPSPGYFPPGGMAPVNPVCNNFVPPSRSAPGIGRINYNARPSVHLNGADLPQDVATLRYFFNLGVEYRMKNNISKESDGDTDDELMPSTSNLKIECKSDQSKEETKYDSNNNSVSRVNGNVENARRPKYSNQSQFLSMRNPNRRFTPRPLLNKERFGPRSNYGRYDAGAVHLQKYNTPSSTRYRNRNSPTNLSITGVDHQNGFGGDENRSDNQTPCSNIASNNLAVDCQNESAKTSVVPSPQYGVPQAPPGALIIPVPSNSYNTGPPSSQPVPINMQQPYAAGGQYNSCLGAPPSSTPLAGNIQMMPSPIMPGMVNNGYYTATGPIAPIHEGENDSGMQYQFVSQPPNMQIYIPTVNNAQNLSPLIPTQPVTAGPPLPPVAGSQGYWCPPAIHQTVPPIITHNGTPQYIPANGIPFGANTPKTANYRRDKQQQAQQQIHAHQFE